MGDKPQTRQGGPSSQVKTGLQGCEAEAAPSPGQPASPTLAVPMVVNQPPCAGGVAETLAKISQQAARNILSFDVALRLQILPLSLKILDEQQSDTVAADRPVLLAVCSELFSEKRRLELERILNLDVVTETISSEILEAALDLAYGKERSCQLLFEAVPPSPSQPLNAAADLLCSMLRYALLYRVSDVHIRICSPRAEIWFRIDGALSEREEIKLDAASAGALARHLRVRAGCDITKCHQPDEGGFSEVVRNSELRIRCSFLPTASGESIVLRILGTSRWRDSSAEHRESKEKQSVLPQLAELGLLEEQQAQLEAMIQSERGAIFFCGPTGSGKSTLLASCMQELVRNRLKILSVENPVEYVIPEVEQVDLNNFPGMGFEDFLPLFLRQDPDVIVLGETRSEKAAQGVLEAACTGHLVFSTLHAGNSAEAFLRLRKLLGKECDLLSSLSGIVVQRLLPRNCRHCLAEVPLERSLRDLLGLHSNFALTARGCPFCSSSGISGRIGVFDFVDTRKFLVDARSMIAQENGLPKQFSSTGAFLPSLRSHILSGTVSPSAVQPLVTEIIARDAAGHFQPSGGRTNAPSATTAQTCFSRSVIELTEEIV